MKATNTPVLAASVWLAQVALVVLAQDETRPSFSVPNPFKELEKRHEQDVRNFGEFYSIKSAQTTISSHKKSRKIMVEEYFSLASGLSFSIHRDISSKDGNSWALISDGPNGKSYIVRNPEESESTYMDCELDHSHEHRHVFPWQYEYDLKTSTNVSSDMETMGVMPAIDSGQTKRRRDRKKRKKNKSGKAIRAAIYGVSAIWLNAIDKGIKSDMIGIYSPYAQTNSWIMEEDDLKLEYLFEKVPKRDSENFDQAKLDLTNLVSIRIKRNNLVQKAHDDPSGLSSGSLEEDHIVVTSFESGLKLDQLQALRLMQVQLSSCRQANKKHRVFPSVLRAMSLSPQRMFHLQYIERKYAKFDSLYANKQVHHLSSGEFDESRHRYVFPQEFVTEIFSLKSETQVTIYDPLPVDGVGPGYGRTDVFMKKFTERGEQARSSRHSTVHYHLIENESEVVGCKVGEMEPPPKQHIFSRPVYFHRPNGNRLSAHLTGLGALLLNVADIHYKSFGLFRRNINVMSNPYKLDEVRPVKVDEWRVDYKQFGWRIHLFFERLNSAGSDHKIDDEAELDDEEKKRQALAPSLTALSRGDASRLVRVDIRDMKAVDPSDSVIEDSSEDRRDDYDLVAQFDIVQFNFEMHQDTLDYLTTVPMGICTGEEPEDDHSDDDDDDDDLDDYYHRNDFYNNFHASDDDTDDESTNGNDVNHLIDQIEAENFEQGDLGEDYDLPDLFEMIDNQAEYEITSRLEIFPEDDSDDDDYDESSKPKKPPPTKYIWLKEVVDLELEISTISLYKTQESFVSDDPYEKYFINYNSEAVFYITKSKCQYLEDITPTPWLRLLSKKLVYSVKPDIKGNNVDLDWPTNQPVMVQSNKLRLYGLGALWQRSRESMFTQFLGRRRKQLADEKDPNIKYNELFWSCEDQSNMRIMFTFLQTVSDGAQPAEKAASGSKLASNKLQLDSVEFSGSDSNLFNHVTEFKSIRVKVLSVEGKVQRLMFVPDVCRDSLIEMKRLKGDGLTEADVQPPTFADLIEETGSYTVAYSVGHKVQTSNEDRASRAIVNEDYDNNQKRGKIVVKASTKTETELYIEGGLKKMFAYNKKLNMCKEITKLNSLVDLGPLMDSGDTSEFEFNSKFGLAALWSTLARQKWTLNIETSFDSTGHKFEKRTYTFQVNRSNSRRSKLEVELTFTKQQRIELSSTWKHGDIKQRKEVPLLLKQIIVKSSPPAKSTTGLSGLNTATTTIDVLHIGRMYSSKWNVPDSCNKLISGSSGSPTTEPTTNPQNKPSGDNGQESKPTPAAGESKVDFPQISHLMSAYYQLHMKSEVSIKHLYLWNTSKFYTVDEWTHNHRLRMKVTHLGAIAKQGDFEFMLNSQSKEVFDLSTPYKCPLSLPNAGLAKGLASNLVAFWANEASLVAHLSQTFYSPLSLWLLAQKNVDKAVLSSSVDIAPTAGPQLSEKDALAKIEKELRSETWRVELPIGKDDAYSKPSYELTFAKWSRQEEDGSWSEWRTLQSIKVNDRIGDNPFEVFVDIMNHNYELTSDGVYERFALPLGWGCRRSPEVFKDTFVDDFQLDLSSGIAGHELIYEATLEVFDEPSTGTPESYISPAIGGTYYKGHTIADNSYPLQLTAHQARIKYPDGNMIATKTVFDMTKNLAYHVDRMTGFCSISLDAQAYWLLEFPLEAHDYSNKQDHQREGILLTDELFETLFLGTPNGDKFSLVNKYSTYGGELVVTSYERELANLRLSDKFNGPASVVRLFEKVVGGHPITQTGGERLVTLHDLVTVRVFIFNSDRSKLRAQLNIMMRQGPRVDLDQLLAETNVIQCFNDGDPAWDRQLASYSVEYDMRFDYLDPDYVRVEFYEMLITRARLTPLQLDGRAHVQLESHDNILRVHFNVLDLPPAHIYFNEIADSTIAEDYQQMVEIKLVPSVVGCSRWCDQLNCVMMSYCDASRSCQIVREEAINMPAELENYLRLVEKHEPSRQCTYYYRSSREPAMNLHRFNQMMDDEINSSPLAATAAADDRKSQRTGPHKFSITLGKYTWEPIRFTEQKNKFRWQHEDRDAPSEVSDLTLMDAGEQANGPWKDLVLGTLKSSAKLDPTKVPTVGRQLNIKYTSTVVVGQDNCVEQCVKYNCLLLHYNKRTKECAVVSAESGGKILDTDHLTQLKNVIVPAEPEYSVKILDFMDKYSKFPTTMAPMDYELRLEDVSAIECALLCQYSREKCLSFDHCSVLNDKLNEPSSYCYLQKTHLTLGTFDKSKLILPDSVTIDNNSQERQVNCDHYSKSVLEDFRRLNNRKLASRPNVATEGINADNCAIDCLENDDCGAFEYCYDPLFKPAQSCYFVRQQDMINQFDKFDPDNQKDLEKFAHWLVESKECSVYVPRRVVAETKLGHGYHSGALLDDILALSQSKSFTQSLHVIVFYLLIAIIAGAFIQFAYIKLMGRPVELFSSFRFKEN